MIVRLTLIIERYYLVHHWQKIHVLDLFTILGISFPWQYYIRLVLQTLPICTSYKPSSILKSSPCQSFELHAWTLMCEVSTQRKNCVSWSWFWTPWNDWKQRIDFETRIKNEKCEAQWLTVFFFKTASPSATNSVKIKMKFIKLSYDPE